MLQVAFYRIENDKVDKLQSWMAEAQDRTEEVRETFREETVRHEQAYLVEMAGGEHLLVYIMELEDPEAAQKAAQQSGFEIDRQHRQVMADVIQGKVEARLLLDVRL